MNNSQRPIARQERLVIQEMPDEILVFDLDTNKAHCLNETAAFVWKACDGENSVADITKLFGNQTGNAVEENLIWLAIDQLSDNNLLANQIKADFKGQSRREVIKKIGMAAVVALPIVASLVAPTAALAVVCSGTVNSSQCGSTCGDGSVCNGTVVCPAGQTGTLGVCSGSACVGTNCSTLPPPSKGSIKGTGRF